MNAADSLAIAWAEVKAALPKGWGIGIEPSGSGYEVGAGKNQWFVWDGIAHPTLAEALHALAARLRDEPR